jgi:RNA polymerase sigma-70 factor (ECF subfamily)
MGASGQAGSSGAAAEPVATRSRFAAQDAAWLEYIRRAARGDESALGALYDESRTLVYSIALRILSDQADAEEVTLDVYTQLWRSAAEYDPGRGSPSAWLVLMTRSRAIDRVRSKAARGRVEELVTEPMERLPAARTEPQTWLDEERAAVRAAIGALAPEHRLLIEMAFFDGFTHSELAARLDLPLGTVKTRIRAAMSRLKEELGRKDPGARYGDGTA